MVDDQLAGGGGFPAAAAGALHPVAGQVEDVRHTAELGGLKLDKDAARTLLTHLGRIRGRVADLVTGCAALDRPLRFGDNWVAGIMAERLRGVAASDTTSVTAVMTEFHEVLDDLEATVRAAAGLYVETDEHSADDMRRAAHRLGLDLQVQGEQ